MWISRGAIVAFLAAVFFSTKAIFVKLTYLHGADAISALALRMVMALPFLLVAGWLSTRGGARPLTRGDWKAVLTAGLRRLLPLQPAGFPRPAIHHRLAGAADPVPLSDHRGADLLAVPEEADRHARHRRPGALLCRHLDLLREGSRAYRRRRDGADRRRLRLRLHRHLCDLHRRRGEMVGRIGALRFGAYATVVAAICCLLQFALTRPRLRARFPVAGLWLQPGDGGHRHGAAGDHDRPGDPDDRRPQGRHHRRGGPDRHHPARPGNSSAKPIGWEQIVGAALVMSGVLLISVKPRPKPAAVPAD